MKKQQPRKVGNGKPAAKKVELGQVERLENIVAPGAYYDSGSSYTSSGPKGQITSAFYAWYYSIWW